MQRAEAALVRHPHACRGTASERRQARSRGLPDQQADVPRAGVEPPPYASRASNSPHSAVARRQPGELPTTPAPKPRLPPACARNSHLVGAIPRLCTEHWRGAVSLELGTLQQRRHLNNIPISKPIWKYRSSMLRDTPRGGLIASARASVWPSWRRSTCPPRELSTKASSASFSARLSSNLRDHDLAAGKRVGFGAAGAARRDPPSCAACELALPAGRPAPRPQHARSWCNASGTPPHHAAAISSCRSRRLHRHARRGSPHSPH